MTVDGTMGSGTGPGGSGAGATFPTGDFPWIADNADVRLPPNNGSFSWVGFVKLTSLSAVAGQLVAVISKWPGGLVTNNSPEFGIYLNRHNADANALWQIDLGTGLDDDPNYSQNSVVSGTSHPTAGVWVHTAAVYDGAANSLKIYIDGVLENTLTPIVNPNIVDASVGGKAAEFTNVVWNPDGSSHGYDASGPRVALAANHADFSCGNADRTFGFWMKRSRINTVEVILIKGAPDSNAEEWDFRLAGSGNSLYFEVSDGGAANFSYALWSANLDNTNWNCVMGWFVASTGKTWISVNDGTPVEGVVTGAFTPATTSHPLRIAHGGPGGQQFLGQLRSIYGWAAVKSPADRTAFYNGGVPDDSWASSPPPTPPASTPAAMLLTC
jgi:hypothetical protein